MTMPKGERTRQETKIVDIAERRAARLVAEARDAADRGDLFEAIGLCLRAIEADGGCGDAFDSIGWCYMKMGESEAALDWLEKAKVAPRHGNRHQTHMNLGRIHLHKLQFWQALGEFEAALGFTPNDKELRFIVERLKGRFDGLHS